LVEVLDRVTMQVFVRRDCTMIAAPVQCDVDGVANRSHSARVTPPSAVLDAVRPQPRASLARTSLTRTPYSDSSSRQVTFTDSRSLLAWWWRLAKLRTYDVNVPRDLTPFPKPGARLIDVGSGNERLLSRSPVPRRDRLLFGCWCAAVFAVSLTATIAIVHRATSRAPDPPSRHYLAVWAACTGGSLLMTAVLGGLVVFGRKT